MTIDTESFSQIPESERAAMIERFKTVSTNSRAIISEQFKAFKIEKDRIVLLKSETISKNNKISK